jgi:glucose/arabinose dehydrogenase
MDGAATRKRPLGLAIAVLALVGGIAAAGVSPVRDARAAADPEPAGPDASSGAVLAAPTDARIRIQLWVSGLSKPVFVTSANDGTGRMFIVEQTGRIKVVKSGKVLSTPFLSLAGKVSRGSEQGLLGLAFHPNFKTNRKLYVNFTNLGGDTVIREYRVSTSNPNVVLTSTARNILKISQPFSNHNGGMLAFGRDGYLYIGMGDGGGSGDPGNRAQRTDTLLGKMLRINVNTASGSLRYGIPSTNPYVGIAGRDEIWQRGLRNPWRWSFDRANGNLWIGDVGQNVWEEVDRATNTAAGPGRGINWGWDDLEGRHCFDPPNGCSTSGKTMPVAEYSHGGGQCAVTGGYVYRGTAIPALVGGYVFGDFCTGQIWVIAANAASPATPTQLLNTNLLISSFGQNAAGELFVVDLNGRIYRILRG